MFRNDKFFTLFIDHQTHNRHIWYRHFRLNWGACPSSNCYISNSFQRAKKESLSQLELTQLILFKYERIRLKYKYQLKQFINMVIKN